MDNIKIKNIIISKQGEGSDNYSEFVELVKKHKINVIIVKAGDMINIDKSSYFYILWPTNELIKENILNNNSIVAKFIYNNKSILFTGDIEEIAEKKIITKYQKTNLLKSDILKVAHHGSKSSSIEEFLSLVKPKIALIGVGESNSFGHPNLGVLIRLKELRCSCL